MEMLPSPSPCPFPSVPNVPCGVEIGWPLPELGLGLTNVPNVPCGVEIPQKADQQQKKYLVPNVPCGVEIIL